MLVAPDRVGPQMAGPGIRYAELARILSRIHDVTLAAPAGSSGLPGFPPLQVYDPAHPASLQQLLADAEVVVAPPLAPALASRLSHGRRRWIADLYNPEPFEGLHAHPAAGRVRRRSLDVLRIDRLTYAARCADAFICAGERQRAMWLGYLAASRRVTSRAHAGDPELRRLIAVVGSGVPEEPPVAPPSPVLRGPVVPEDARIAVWNGGVWPWLDLRTSVDAVAALRARDRRWVLVIAGAGRPGRASFGGEALREAHARLGDSGLHVVAAWTDYDRRGDVLLEADVGICTHRAGVESQVAERVRVLDLLWAGVPVACSAGDPVAELVGPQGLGRVVPPGDSQALARALAEIADAGRAAFAPALASAAAKRRWSATAVPLLALIADDDGPRRRPGLVARSVAARHRLAGAAGRALVR
jgi:glycosyltransferase involved in cell wall biosynthesis